MSGIKMEIEKFDGRINFGLWQVQVKDLLIQHGLHKALKGNPTPVTSNESSKTNISDGDWEDFDLRAASAIRLCLAKNILANVHGISTAKELWEKLEELYQAKGVSNRVYLKEKFHTLRMNEGTTMSDHLSILNGIISELETIGVKLDDEDIALRLIWSLPSSYEHMKPILIHGKEKVIFSEVTSKLLSEEKRLSNGNNVFPTNSALVAHNRKHEKFIKKKIVCWGCGQLGHLKRNCQNVGNHSRRSSNTDGDANYTSTLEDYSDAL